MGKTDQNISSEEIKKNIANNIRKYRKRNHETQVQLGEVLGYGATTIANYEKGIRSPDMETLMRIKQHYCISHED